ncbi:hypothetical protein PR048_024978 [Dryococelus australis]|uniref:Uncharacterized protein n=1 Tax=Dryococelus australis TaxID=614101 RepID=A0ABQ9GQ36_9NEOP|nr:hypothetical protein PR048_024978 [Dryococelus australis]
MEQRRNEYPRENPPSSGIVRHDSRLRKSGVTRLGIEPVGFEQSNRSATAAPFQDMIRNLCPERYYQIDIVVVLQVPLSNGIKLETSHATWRVNPDIGVCQKYWSHRMAFAVPMRVFEASLEQRRNERAAETGNSRENSPTNGIVRHDSHMRKSGVTRSGIEPGIALVGGERTNRSATVAPTSKLPFRTRGWMKRSRDLSYPPLGRQAHCACFHPSAKWRVSDSKAAEEYTTVLQVREIPEESSEATPPRTEAGSSFWKASVPTAAPLGSRTIWYEQWKRGVNTKVKVVHGTRFRHALTSGRCVVSCSSRYCDSSSTLPYIVGASRSGVLVIRPGGGDFRCHVCAVASRVPSSCLT